MWSHTSRALRADVRTYLACAETFSPTGTAACGSSAGAATAAADAARGLLGLVGGLLGLVGSLLGLAGLARLLALGLLRSGLGGGLGLLGGLFGLLGSGDRGLRAGLVGGLGGLLGGGGGARGLLVGALLLIDRLVGRALGLRSLFRGVVRHFCSSLSCLVLVIGSHRTLPLESWPR